MRAALIRSILSCCLASAPLAANAAWLQVESENFVLIGDVREEKAVGIIHDLEVYRRLVLSLAGEAASPEIRKIHIYGMRSASDVVDVTGQKGLAAVYTTGEDFPVIVTPLGSSSDTALSMALHELAHHILHAHTAQFFPRWYDEGFAEFLASFRVEGEIVNIGEPSSRFGNLLYNPKWVDIETVVNAIADYPFDSGGSSIEAYRSSMFYGVSWLAVHYLQNTAEVNRGFGDYVTLLNQGRDPAQAFREGFGISEQEFGKRLHDYWRANRFPVVQFRIAEPSDTTQITTIPVSDKDAEIALIQIRALFLSKDADADKPRRKVRRRIGKLMDEYGPSALLYKALKTVELREGNYNEAVATGEMAYTLSPDDRAAVQTLADALFHRYVDGGMRDKTDIARARSLFRDQLAMEPANPTANSHFPATFLLDETEPDRTALKSVAFNLRYRRNPVNFHTYLDNAEVLLRANYSEEACSLLGLIDRWVRAADGGLSDEQRREFRRKGRETHLERLNRLEGELGDGCTTAFGS